MGKFLLFIVIFCIVFFSFQLKKETITRVNEPSFAAEISEKIPHVINFNDTIPNDTLWEHISENRIPAMYSREIVTGVCIKGECRMVTLELFWNITGSYLGFKIPDGEFLSKTEHVKFNANEYDRLHELLGQYNSALVSYELKELVPKVDSTKNKVDAVSSATIAAVLDYIVEGAVYTTYTLWHIVYGPTKREIEKLTTAKLDSEIVLKLLNSQYLKDKIWALNHITEQMEISAELQKKLIEIISGNDIYLAERSLNAIKPENLNTNFQKDLITIFENTGFLQKRLIIQKLKVIPSLINEDAELLSFQLENLSGTLVKNMLELFNFHKIDNEIVSANISALLKNENRYITTQALNYLESVQNLDKKTLKSIERFKKKY